MNPNNCMARPTPKRDLASHAVERVLTNRRPKFLSAPAFFLLTLIGFTSMPAVAQQWSELAPDVQATLATVEENWDQLADDQRQKLVRGAERWLTMDAEQKATALSRLERWQSLSVEEKQAIRARCA